MSRRDLSILWSHTSRKSVHGLGGLGFCPSSGNSANAISNVRRDQIVRLFTRFGLGIRPSDTISSNSRVLTPTYSAASARESPSLSLGGMRPFIALSSSTVVNAIGRRMLFGRVDHSTVAKHLAARPLDRQILERQSTDAIAMGRPRQSSRRLRLDRAGK